MKQRERDLALLAHWEEQKMYAERAVETANRQIAYLGQLLVQHSLEDLGMRYADERDTADTRDADPTME